MEGPQYYIDGVSAGYGGGSFVGTPGSETETIDGLSSLADGVWTRQRIEASYEEYKRNFDRQQTAYTGDDSHRIVVGGQSITVGQLWADMQRLGPGEYADALDFTLTNGILYSRVADRFTAGDLGKGELLANLYAGARNISPNRVWAGTAGPWTQLRASLFSGGPLHNMVVHESFHVFHPDWPESRVCFEANRLGLGRVECF